MKQTWRLTIFIIAANVSTVMAGTADVNAKRVESPQETVERRGQELKDVRRNPDRLKSLETLEKLQTIEMHEQVRLGNIYGELLVKRLWDERELGAELNLLYAVLLAYAEAHEAKLPESTAELPIIDGLDLREYHYFPVEATDELSDEIVLAIPREVLVFADGKHVYVGDGDMLRRMSIPEYKKLMREQGENGKWHLAFHMRQLEPKLRTLMGDGSVVDLLQTSYEEVVEKSNEKREAMGYDPIPIEVLHKIFAPVDASIFIPYRRIKGPGRDKYGRKIEF
jgi:hypothetical protein